MAKLCTTTYENKNNNWASNIHPPVHIAVIVKIAQNTASIAAWSG